MTILPTLRQLQYFLTLSQTLSFSAAAEACHITQPTLSVAITELENLLGQKLFVRGTRTVTLTRTGEDLIPYVRALLDDAANLVHLARTHRPPLSGKLALGVIPTIAPYLLPRFLPTLQKDYPSLDLILKEDLSARQIDALKNGTIDVVLMAFPYDTPQIEQFPLWNEPFFLAEPGEYTPGKEPPPLSLDDLEQETILLLDDGHCLRDHILESCRLHADTANRKTLGATSLETLIRMVQHGYGSTLLPSMALSGSSVPQGVMIRRFKNPQPYRTVGLAWRKSDPRAAEFRLLGDLIKSCKSVGRR